VTDGGDIDSGSMAMKKMGKETGKLCWAVWELTVSFAWAEDDRSELPAWRSGSASNGRWWPRDLKSLAA